MDTVLSAVLQLCMTGGVIYLIVEKMFSRRKEKAEAQTIEISNGNDVAELYNKIDEIVQKKITAETKRICAELADVKNELKEIKSHWCCYRESCGERILFKQRSTAIIKQIENESKRHICKN